MRRDPARPARPRPEGYASRHRHVTRTLRPPPTVQGPTRRRRSMKLTRLLVIPACAAATVGGAGATATASTHGVARGAASCGSKLSVLVWPHGHPPIPSVNFPEIRNPHVE